MIYFAKAHPDAKIPTKELGNAGRDLYACFKEDWMYIPPHSNKLIPIEIASAFPDTHYFEIKERGSTGTKQMEVRAGVIDSNFRGSWFVCLSNGTDHPIVICKEHAVKSLEMNFYDCCISQYTIYPYEKAIAQAVYTRIDHGDVEEISIEDLKAMETTRGDGQIGSSGK